jgi:hypothetical protein
MDQAKPMIVDCSLVLRDDAFFLKTLDAVMHYLWRESDALCYLRKAHARVAIELIEDAAVFQVECL